MMIKFNKIVSLPPLSPGLPGPQVTSHISPEATFFPPPVSVSARLTRNIIRLFVPTQIASFNANSSPSSPE